MAAPSKTQLLTEVYERLRKRYKLEPRSNRLSVLEAVIYGICHEGTTREQANQAMSRFKDEFFDWNEVRVSSLREIQGVLAGLPAPEERARRLRKFLKQLFDRTYSFTLDALVKKPQKEAVKALREFEALQSDYVLATVIQQALGGHAIPIDAPIRRGLERLGVAEPGQDTEALRCVLERTIPKNRGHEFVDLLEELTHDTCVEGTPDCPRCELLKLCPTGQYRLMADPTSTSPMKADELVKGSSLASAASKPSPGPAKKKARPTSAPQPSAPDTALPNPGAKAKPVKRPPKSK